MLQEESIKGENTALLPSDITCVTTRVLDHSSYKKSEKIFDAFLLALACYAQFGFATYWQENALISITDPLHRYLYPHLSEGQSAAVTQAFSYVMQTFAMSDATLTVGNYLNIRRCRHELTLDWHYGLNAYRKNEISTFLFVANIFLIWSFFAISSLSPWSGFARSDYNDLMTNISGPLMWFGLMISYAMGFAPYNFSGSKKISNFFRLTNWQKLQILKNVFLTKKGLFGFLPRTLLSVMNRSWIQFGSAELAMIWVFKSDNKILYMLFAILSVLCTAYQVFMSQGIKDYNLTFANDLYDDIKFLARRHIALNTDMHDSQESGNVPIETNNTRCGKVFSIAHHGILLILTLFVFLLRTLATPSLYTGAIDNPAENYDVKDAVLATLGIFCGGYAAYQYAQFRYTRWQETMSSLFKKAVNNNRRGDLPVARDGLNFLRTSDPSRATGEAPLQIYGMTTI